ncbi:MAG: homocysteine biosynthesis protein [Planctomycetes bacterium]|nr:homocysteine biosynthesis protein [Planctomycetota bacterium]
MTVKKDCGPVKSFKEINERIASGKAVVVTAEEIIDIVQEDGPEKAARSVDVVTTGTFGIMCSSGAMLNTGHTKPKIKMNKASLNGVPAYCGLAAVDLYIGAAELQEDDPANRIYPGEFRYGGGHVIEDLVAGRRVEFRASGYGTDCYPAKEAHGYIKLSDLNQALLLNPRNSYQNYNVAVNVGDRTIYTYMGMLLPRIANANYSSAGQLSPLLNDPYYRTVGIGTRVFLGGAQGYVIWHGTQHAPRTPRSAKGIPLGGAGTLALIGDLKHMSPEFLRGASVTGYGTSLAVGFGLPIPVLSPEIAAFTAVRDSDITAPIVDYSRDYPNAVARTLGSVDYASLRSGSITVEGKKVVTASLSSYRKARDIALILKDWISSGRFLLSEPVAPIPGPDDPDAPEFSPLKLKAH